jgi:hypothetical protein
MTSSTLDSDWQQPTDTVNAPRDDGGTLLPHKKQAQPDENLRPLPPGDPDFERLFPRRNDAESIKICLHATESFVGDVEARPSRELEGTAMELPPLGSAAEPVVVPAHEYESRTFGAAESVRLQVRLHLCVVVIIEGDGRACQEVR